MASGEFGGNQSVHWQITHENDLVVVPQPNPNRPTLPHNVHRQGPRLQGRDPKAVADVNGDGFFRVRLRFDSLADAQARFNEATAAPVATLAGGYYVVLKVRAIERVQPDAAPPKEIEIRW